MTIQPPSGSTSPRLGLVLAALLVLLPVFACSGSHLAHGGDGGGGSGGGSGAGGNSDSGGGGGDAGGQACVIAPPSAVQLPHVDASGAKATDVMQALAAILSSQTPPISPGQVYRIPTLDCGSGCTFQVQIDGGQPINVSVTPPSSLAKDLYDALGAAGAVPCEGDPRSGPSLSTLNLMASATAVQFDDVSIYEPLPAPNVVAMGAAAQGVVAAFAAAGLGDCDPSRKVFLGCNNVGQPPDCATMWIPLKKVGSSWLRDTCVGSAITRGIDVDADRSLGLWRSILAAAQSGGFQPPAGTIEQTSSVDARFFTWDGTSLGFSLVTSSLTSSPAPTGGQ